jgi:hypothetical protein
MPCVTLPDKIELLFNEKVIEFVSKSNPSQKQLYEKFQDYSYILGQILSREEAWGTIQSYKNLEETRYRVTQKGIEALKGAKDLQRFAEKHPDDED